MVPRAIFSHSPICSVPQNDLLPCDPGLCFCPFLLTFSPATVCASCQATNSVKCLKAKNQPQQILLANHSLLRNQQLLRLRNTFLDLILPAFQAIPSAELNFNHLSLSIQIFIQKTNKQQTTHNKTSTSLAIISVYIFQKYYWKGLQSIIAQFLESKQAELWHLLPHCFRSIHFDVLVFTTLTLLEQKGRSTSHNDHLTFTVNTEYFAW